MNIFDEEFPEEEYPLNQVRKDIPFWRFTEFLDHMAVDDEENELLKLHYIRPEDNADMKLLNRKLKFISRLIQSKCN